MTFVKLRSPKVLATIAVIDALKYSDSDLAELTKYLADRCGFGHIPKLVNIDDLNGLLEFYDIGEPPDNDDDDDPSEKPCPCGEGTTTLRDCDGRPCGFIQTYEDIPLCPPEISKLLGYEEDDDYIDIITRKDDDDLED